MKSLKNVVVCLGFIVLLMPLTASSAFAQDGQDAEEIGIQTVRVFTAGAHFFKRVLTEDVAIVLNPGAIGADGFSAYVNLPGAGPANGAIAVVAPRARSSTSASPPSPSARAGEADVGWCGVRILINGVEAQPAPADFAFDSTNNGADGTAPGKVTRMDRHLCVRNPGATNLNVPVQVQWRVFAGVDRCRPAVPARRLEPHDRERQSELPVAASQMS